MQISIFTILPHWDTRGNSFVGLGVGLIGFFTLSRDVNLRDTEFLSYVIRLASRRTESPRFIYFQINSIYFLNTCTCVINSLDHQRKPNEMQTISGVASVLTTHPYPLTERQTPPKVSPTPGHKRRPTSTKTESGIVVILGRADPMEVSTKCEIKDLITTCFTTFMLSLLMCFATQKKSLKNIDQYKVTSCEANYVH